MPTMQCAQRGPGPKPGNTVLRDQPCVAGRLHATRAKAKPRQRPSSRATCSSTPYFAQLGPGPNPGNPSVTYPISTIAHIIAQLGPGPNPGNAYDSDALNWAQWVLAQRGPGP